MLIRPTITGSGMTARQHIRLRMNARTAIDAAITAMSDLRPNGRDYIGEPERLREDTAIHESRQLFLRTLYNELMEEAVTIHRLTSRPSEEK